MTADYFTIDCYAGATSPSSQPAAQSTAQSRDADEFHFISAGDQQNAYVTARSHFESTETDRTNEAHWFRADRHVETPINQVLADRLPVMRARSNHERINNTTLDGLALSHTLAVIGENGPMIDLVAENTEQEQWCQDAEGIWNEWCQRADAAGELDLGGLLKQWNYAGWYNGEWIEQLVSEDPTVESFSENDISLRLHGIEVQRLVTPFEKANDLSVILGIRRNKYRRPVEYFIRNDYWSTRSVDGNWYRAADIVHGMDKVQAERGQARGIPWMQSGLPLAADLRDYDVQVMDAARLTADGAVFAYTESDDADYVDNVPRAIGWRRRMINHLAPKWKLASVQSNQPLPQYKEFRHERMNDLGRSKGVPGMVTRLDARDHNYSSARFDYQLLGESAKHLRSTLYNPILRRLFTLVMSEAILLGRLGRPPRRFYQEWIWPSLPEIDPIKAAEAETIQMRNGTLPYSVACRRNFIRPSDAIRRRQRDDLELAAAGLPTVAQATARSASAQSAASDAAADANNSNQG